MMSNGELGESSPIETSLQFGNGCLTHSIVLGDGGLCSSIGTYRSDIILCELGVRMLDTMPDPSLGRHISAVVLHGTEK
jgi:hypothetical protein